VGGDGTGRNVAAAAFSTGWLVPAVLLIDVVIAEATFYVREARGQRRGGELTLSRRRMFALTGILVIACARAFVFKA
jgi:hypothetical protein